MTLENKHVSIKYFDSEGIEIVSTVTGIDVETIEFELENGNHLIGQAESGNFYFFCETDEVENEITFYEFLVRLRDFKTEFTATVKNGNLIFLKSETKRIK